VPTTYHRARGEMVGTLALPTLRRSLLGFRR